MTWHDVAKSQPPETLLEFTKQLETKGLTVHPTATNNNDHGRDFVVNTPIGQVWIIDVNGLWTLRLRIPAAKYFADAAEWKACLKGQKRSWHSPDLEESIQWITETLSEGIPQEITPTSLDQIAEFRIRHGNKIVWMFTGGIAVALLALSLGLFWVASVTKNTIAGINAFTCAIIFVTHLFKSARFMRSLRK
ncbi:hypothetical protein EII34_15555 [Arachnia propionica]|uniref:Uncharacterized protein n=1 Tax=Arachnia propionica TaxID=1750 RepID=A0A3P1T325_9ACTN|nr:hypothetical protein [Arachnia propionica]RRD02873.1 hypothetical protein EII34_15555 [Arachnia propionica]